MRIYISGKITGLDYADVEAKFQDAQDLLSDIGFEVVNPLNNGLTKEHSWEQHMVKDIELLLPCDAIYMMDNWTESVGAGIEHDIAKRTGKIILNEVDVAHSHEIVLQIQNAIQEVTGMRFKDYTTKSREREKFFARMIFAHHCNENDIDPIKYIHRDRTMIYHYLNQYHDEMKFNSYFKKLARRIEEKLNPKKRTCQSINSHTIGR